MRALVAALGLLAISASPALAQSQTPCSPHRMRNFVAIGAGIGAAVAVTGGCRECALIGAPVGAIWGRVIAEGTSSKCSIDPAKSGAAARAQITPPADLVAPPAIEDFSRVRLKPGQKVVVTERGGTFGGMVTSVAPGIIAIGGRSISPNPELTIEKEGDTLGNGAAYGFIFGALAGSTVGAEACLNEPLWHCAVGNGLVFAGIGAWIDHRRVGRTTVYDGHAKSSAQRAWNLSPAIGRHTKGVALTRRFR